VVETAFARPDPRPTHCIGEAAIPSELRPKQRAHLKSLAHHLKAIQYIGKEGVTEASLHAIEDAFRTRELLKVKVQEAAPASAKEIGAELAERLDGVQHVQTIGRTVVLYRRHPEKPEIVLPAVDD
jgi:RNA-binding protein